MMLVKFYKFYAFMFINIFVNFVSVFVCVSIHIEKLPSIRFYQWKRSLSAWHLEPRCSMLLAK